jgi:translation initiation factor 2 beta subunit (eIF-2beta)/eIF-5
MKAATNKHAAFFMVLTREGKQKMTNPFSKIAEVIEQDHKKIEEHTVKSLRNVLTTDIKEYGFDNENISNHDVDLLLRLVGNIIKVKCRQVYRDEI